MNLILFSNSQPITSETDNSTEGIKDVLIKIAKSPIFYIIIGSFILLVVLLYILRRVIKPKPNAVSIILRRGKVFKIIDEKSKSFFMAPFIDKLGAVISLGENVLSSDKLFINNGPDALYQIDYTLTYKILDPEKFFDVKDDIENLIVTKINDDLREFADKGGALLLIKDYRNYSTKILDLINLAISPFSVVALYFKINLIQPLGRK